MLAAGILRGGSELKPVSTAVTISVRGGKLRKTDGPYAETKEQMGGYYIIDVASVDEAAKWAAKCPGRKEWLLRSAAAQSLAAAGLNARHKCKRPTSSGGWAFVF